MCGGLRKTVVALVVRRGRKGAFVRRYRYISSVRTEVHMFTCLFVHICLHMTYTNVILCNMRVTTFLRRNLMKRVYVYLKQDGVSNDPETFSCHKNIYDLACANTKTSQITRQDRFLWGRHNASEVVVSLTAPRIAGVGVHAT
jgi:ABC-type histidine transport system ATPase subunit